MADTTTALPSQIEPVVDRNRRWSPIWYPWIKKLLETIRTEAAANFAVRETVDEIEGKWSVDITEGGKVRGAVKLDASETLSVFAVLADRFTVSQPDGSGEKLVFAIGTVNGASAYGLGPLMVLDGAIVARHLDVESLSAITANVGTVTAGVLRSSDSNFVIDLNNKTLTIST